MHLAYCVGLCGKEQVLSLRLIRVAANQESFYKQKAVNDLPLSGPTLAKKVFAMPHLRAYDLADSLDAAIERHPSANEMAQAPSDGTQSESWPSLGTAASRAGGSRCIRFLGDRPCECTRQEPWELVAYQESTRNRKENWNCCCPSLVPTSDGGPASEDRRVRSRVRRNPR